MKTLDEALDEHCKQVFNEKKSSEFVNQAQISFTKGSLFGFESGVKQTKEEYEEKLRWIPVEERFPENYCCQIAVRKPKEKHADLRVFFHSGQFKQICKIHGYTEWRYFL